MSGHLVEGREKAPWQGDSYQVDSYSTKDDLDRVIDGLRSRGICYICRDLETGEIFGEQPTVYDDERLRVVLTLFPRMKGHTIVIFKPHREDISEINGEETSEIFGLCVRTDERDQARARG